MTTSRSCVSISRPLSGRRSSMSTERKSGVYLTDDGETVNGETHGMFILSVEPRNSPSC